MDRLKILLVIAAIFCVPFILGIIEKRGNEKNLKKLKVRINVNGIRGKSTATRMLTAILKEAGMQVVGKTTGSAARIIYWDREEEEEVRRKPRGVSISEQIRVIRKAVRHGANALVCECMAVRPEYQRVYQHDIIKAQIVVIVNVVEDHLDEMGPTLEQLAWAFGDTIPYNGIAVIPDCEFTRYFQKIAAERHSKAVVIHPEIIPEQLMDFFEYRVFPNNCAVALYTALELGIPLDTIIQGMLHAAADPGALRITPISGKGITTWFVNAFAANEPTSTLEIWDSLQYEDIPMEDPIVVMNCRPDRVDRTAQFVKDCFPLMGSIQLVVIGEKAYPVHQAFQKGRLPNLINYTDLEGLSVPEIIEYLIPMLDGHTMIGVGNIHGIGEAFTEAVYALGNTVPPTAGESAAGSEANHMVKGGQSR